MLKSSIHADLRNDVGTNACHRVRDHGHVPGVVYGQNTNSRSVEVDKKVIDTILRNYGTSAFLDLDMNGDTTTVLIKEIQRHPVTNEIIHVDFQHIAYDKPIHTTIPIVLRGKEQVESKNSVVQQQLRELHISCLPQHMPENIELNISVLRPNQPLRVADVEFGTELTILNDPEEIIASLTRSDRVIDDPGEGESK